MFAVSRYIVVLLAVSVLYAVRHQLQANIKLTRLLILNAMISVVWSDSVHPSSCPVAAVRMMSRVPYLDPGRPREGPEHPREYGEPLQRLLFVDSIFDVWLQVQLCYDGLQLTGGWASKMCKIVVDRRARPEAKFKETLECSS